MTKAPIRVITDFSTTENKPASIPEAKILRVLELMRYLKIPRNVNDIAKKLHVHQRTAYRYLHLLEAFDVVVSRDGFDNFFIEPKYCPFCSVAHRR